MIVRRRRSPVFVAAVLAVGSLLAPGQAPSTAGSDGACPGTTGVTVVVDYPALGGGVVVRCAPGSPATGFKALDAAGFSITQVQNVPGFLCRIDGKPGPADDECVNTPPASAYWSYWHASRGGSWVASSEGGKTRTPPPGSVDGWSFSDGGTTVAPGIAPPAKSATPTAATAKPATAKPATAKPTTPKPVLTARPTDSPSAPSNAPTPTPTPTLAPLPTPTPMPTPTPVIAAEPSAFDAGPSDGLAGVASGGNPPVGTLLGIGLVVLIAGGALVARARRPRGQDGDA